MIRTITVPSAGSEQVLADEVIVMHVLQSLESGAAAHEPTWPPSVTPDLAVLRIAFVNVLLYGRPGAPSGSWVLIDAGLPGSAARITRAARQWIGPWAKPSAIVLTHGHFDHVGALHTLAEM